MAARRSIVDGGSLFDA